MKILGMGIPELVLVMGPFLLSVAILVFFIVMMVKIAKATERTAAATEAMAQECMRRSAGQPGQPDAR